MRGSNYPAPADHVDLVRYRNVYGVRYAVRQTPSNSWAASNNEGSTSWERLSRDWILPETLEWFENGQWVRSTPPLPAEPGRPTVLEVQFSPEGWWYPVVRHVDDGLWYHSDNSGKGWTWEELVAAAGSIRNMKTGEVIL